MILIDERKLTNGTLQMIGQDYGVSDFNFFEIEKYSDKVINVLLKEEREYYKETYIYEITKIINLLIENNRGGEALDMLKFLIEYVKKHY